MSQEALVSIVLPTIGDATFLEASIASCLAQSYDALELIIVCAAESAMTSRLPRDLTDRRIQWVEQTNTREGLAGALNLGFARARGELFTWTQDDDILATDALAALVNGLRQHPDVGLVYGGTVFIDEKGARIGSAPLESPEALSRTNPVGHSFLYRRAVAEAVGPYDPAFRMAEDLHYWLRVFRCFPMMRLDGSLCFHRLHRGSLTCRGYGAYESLRVAAVARQRVLGLRAVTCRRQIAAAYVEEAFRAYQRHDYGHVWPSLIRAALRDPRELALVGVASIAARSLVRA